MVRAYSYDEPRPLVSRILCPLWLTPQHFVCPWWVLISPWLTYDVLHSCSVHIEFPKIEVRYEDLTVDAYVHVGSRALPTIPNFICNMTEVGPWSLAAKSLSDFSYPSTSPCTNPPCESFDQTFLVRRQAQFGISIFFKKKSWNDCFCLLEGVSEAPEDLPRGQSQITDFGQHQWDNSPIQVRVPS